MNPEQIVLRAVARVPSYAIFAFDSKGSVLSWNEGVLEVLGFGSDDFLGSDADRIFTPRDRQSGEPQRERELALKNGSVGDFRWHLRKDGSHFWANGVVHTVRDDDGEFAAFVKIARDATNEKRIQEALQEAHDELERRVAERTSELMDASEQLRRSEVRFAEVFRVAPIGITLTTLDDRLIDVNEAFERITGYPRAEVVGRNAKTLGLWSSAEDQQKLREVNAGESGFRTLELQIRTRDGEVREILSSAAAVDIDHTEGLVKMFLDITERKRTERHLMSALQEVMQDTSWLAHRVMEKLAQTRGESGPGPELSDLTAREREVLACIAQGKNNEQIGKELHLAASTVRNYVTSIYSKIDVESRAEAVVWARDRGLAGL